MYEDLLKSWSNEKADELAREFRFVITDMICRSGSGHIGGALSLVETVISLYWRIMKVNPDEPRWDGRDRLILSKGHAGPVLYAALAYRGYFPMQWLTTLNQDGTMLPSHVDQIRTPGIDITAGSLGQGLSCAAGAALASKIDKKNHNVFCIIGDGESDEGQVWEAAMFAGHRKIDNLIAITDYNKMQIDGTTDEVVTLEPIVDKWRAFNWEVFEMDGHDWDDINKKISAAIAVTGKPAMIIAHTVKGRGNTAVEGQVGSHNIKVGDKTAYEKYIKALGYECKLPYGEE